MLARLRGDWDGPGRLYCVRAMSNTENIIERARTLLCYMSEHEVANTLAESGVSNEDAFLCIKAAKILNTQSRR